MRDEDLLENTLFKRARALRAGLLAALPRPGLQLFSAAHLRVALKTLKADSALSAPCKFSRQFQVTFFYIAPLRPTACASRI
jgi:hypothetical protein